MRLRGADLLARTLAAAGARHVFTLSGNHVMPVFDAALEAKLDLVHVRHEAAAVHMADAWGRLTGTPGVALVTGGPGHANAVGALYTALAADSPLVLISGHAPLGELGKGAFQEMRQSDIAAPLTKASWTARSAETLGEDVARAWREACSDRPGPVHLSVPSDVLDALTDAEVPGDFSVQRAVVSPSVLEELKKAQRPLVITLRQRAPEFEEATGIPVIAMESPRGVNDPSLGHLAKLLASADMVLLAGKRRDFTLKFGKVFAPDCRLLEAEGELVLPRSFSPINGDWRAQVNEALKYRPPEWAGLRSQPGGPPHPVEICRAVQPLLEARDAVLVCDGGEFGQWAQACLSAPRRVINGPAGSIGSALPFAAAAKLAFPEAPVVAMLGDGTFGFHVSEIDTAVRRGLGYVAVIGNDACWNAEYQIQLRAYGKQRAHGLDLLPTRYGAAAAALGAHGEDVSQLSELQAAMERARGAGRVACVNVMIERIAAPTY
jgi:thiamine pyrophosphate-dependent acetolactate synthase large subunit-like protein